MTEEEKVMRCILCGVEFYDSDCLFEHSDEICPACWQEELREKYGYNGDII